MTVEWVEEDIEFEPPFNLKASQLVEMAPSDRDAAAEALLMVADFIRRGERLPRELSNFIASGIETAMKQPKFHDPHNADRGRALLVALHLETNCPRPSKVSSRGVHMYMASLMGGWIDADGQILSPPHKTMKQTPAARMAAKKYGIKVGKAHLCYREQQKIWEKKSIWKSTL